MRTTSTFLNLIQTLPEPKYFTEAPKGSDMRSKTPYIVIKGHPCCLTRGFDTLRGKKDVHTKTVKTSAGEMMERKMKIVFVQEYDPVENSYTDLGDFWADIATGTLYRQFDGICMSSTMIWMELQ